MGEVESEVTSLSRKRKTRKRKLEVFILNKKNLKGDNYGQTAGEKNTEEVSLQKAMVTIYTTLFNSDGLCIWIRVSYYSLNKE